jgi:putative two-component system response regulator
MNIALDKQRIVPSKKMPNVLIVDDEAMHRRLEVEILGDDYNVFEAKNGEEAIELVQTINFDVILLDRKMPGMSGNQVCHYIRETLGQKLVPILMVTASNSAFELQQSLNLGATDFIRKPYDTTEYFARVKSAIKHKKLTDNLDSAELVLFALARMVEARDEGTAQHCNRLSYYAKLYGTHLGLSAIQKAALDKACVLHDIGKLGIPDRILLKKGPLTEDEWKIMHQHTVIGAKLCSEINSLSDVLPIILHHHEKWDGSGYPESLEGEDIPLLARVFQLLDIFDALNSERPYKKKFSKDKICQIIREEQLKGWRSPTLTDNFLEFLKNNEYLFDADLSALKEGTGEKLFNKIAETVYQIWD